MKEFYGDYVNLGTEFV